MQFSILYDFFGAKFRLYGGFCNNVFADYGVLRVVSLALRSLLFCDTLWLSCLVYPLWLALIVLHARVSQCFLLWHPSAPIALLR